MKDKLREFAACGECGMTCEPGEFHPYAACLMFKGCHNSTTVRANLTQPKILDADADADAGVVDFPRYRAIGFDAETNCAEMVADPDGAWVHVMDIPQVHPERSGVVSDEELQTEAEAFAVRAGFTYGWKNLESWARRMAERAALEHFAKGASHDR